MVLHDKDKTPFKRDKDGKHLAIIIDSNQEGSHQTKSALTKAGYQTRIFEDGPGALRFIDRQSANASWAPEMILVDILLPHMSSFETIRRLSTRFDDNKSVLIFLTSPFDPREDFLEAQNAGAISIIPKPVQFLHIQSHIESMKKRKHQSQVGLQLFSKESNKTSS